ncbi:MAG: vWA domain-containing protein [Myxococcota bacterium]|nr:vWA domain-containing protein [Myxococcota bacterium]
MRRENRAIVAMAALVVVVAAGGCSPDDSGGSPGDVPRESLDGGCNPAARYCSADRRQVLACDPASGGSRVVGTCSATELCVDGACARTVCSPGQAECTGDSAQRLCRSDGSGWDETACADGTICNAESGVCEVPCSLRVFILLDKSGSMSDGTPPKWDQARAAIRTLMTGSTATDVEFGFGAFPTDSNCATRNLVIHPIPEATAANVDSFFGRGPNGNTPLAAAMQFFLTDTSANLHDPSYHNSILLVSDGIDTCHVDCLARCGFNMTCLLACEREAEILVTESLTETTARLRDEFQIRTFVIGFGGGISATQLQAIAENGGTALRSFIPADNIDELTRALDTIIDELRDCNPILI